ncbi:serine/threonine-protein kinase [Streptomyces syringium]|uniref:serine/threonine-protein kinase n=1 Tax=Streptomyces syringium TaxID=76729 RepID=UPI00343E3BCD
MTGGASGPSGRIIDGRFALLERLGSGGMGTVWRARDLALHREVALKEVRAPETGSAAPGSEATRVLRERVLREARALARLSHPNVVTIHHIVAQDPHPWLVMELLPGDSLQDRLDGGPLPPQEAARVGREVLSALRAAHAAGIHHRDVKPANVLLRADGRAVLTDFGIAALQGSTALTAAGDLIGSPEYIAPERIRGGEEIPASDFWSLGMLLYVAVEGISPLRRATTLATLAAVLDDPVPPPVRSGPLAPVLTALLVRDPAARPDGARLDELLARAEAAPAHPPTRWDNPRPPATPPHSLPTVTNGSGGTTGPTGPTGPMPPGVPRSRRGPLAVVAAAVAAVLLAGGVYLAVEPGGDGTRAAGSPGTGVSPGTAERTPTPRASGAGSPAPQRPSPSPTPSRAVGPAPAGPAGTWIAQLHSEPVSTGTATRDRRLATLRESIPEAVMLRSDDYASLNPGYWVFYAPGPFANGFEAVSWCAERGRITRNACVGRYVSHSAGDRDALCLPATGAAGDSSSGRCTLP